MGRGGQRVGAGRKPNQRGVVLGMDGTRRQAPDTRPGEPVGDPVGLAIPPADLSDSRRALWAIYAPEAIQEGTLLRSRVLGFRQLVAQLEMVQEIDRKIGELGTSTLDAADLHKTYWKAAQRLDSTMARFKLTSLGKSEIPKRLPGQVTAPSQWAAVGRR